MVELLSEPKLETILASAIAAIAHFRCFAGRVLECEYRSPGSAQIFGFDPTHLQQNPDFWWSRVEPQDREQLLQQWFHAIFNCQQTTLEYRFCHGDGSWRWIAETLNARCDETGHCWQVVTVATDISARKRVEEALVLHRDRYTLATENGDVAIWEYYPATQQGYLSPQWQLMTGHPCAAQTPLQFWSQVMPAVDYEGLRRHVQGCLQGQAASFEVEHRLTHRQGGECWAMTRGTAFWDAAGQVYKLAGVAVDITTRKRIEEELQRQLQASQAMQRVIQVIHHSLNLETIFATAVAEVGALLQVDQVAIIHFGADATAWRSLADYRCQPNLPHAPTIIPPRESALVQQLQQLQVVRLDPTHPVDPTLMAALPGHVPVAWLLVPLEVDQQAWGCLSLCHYRAHEWQAADVALAGDVAAHLAIAIQQSHLYQQVQQFNTDLEQQVQARTAQLQQAYEFESALKQITEKVRDSLDESQILQSAVEALATTLGIPCCNAALFDHQQRTATVCYEYTTLPQPVQGRICKMDDFPELYGQLNRNLPFQFCSLLYHPVRGRVAMLACPIFDDQEVLGDLWLVHQPDHSFDEREIRLVEQVANQCAIALRQSRLYQASQAQVVELERLNQLKDDFLSTVSHELRTPISSIKLATQMLDVLMFQPAEQQLAGAAETLTLPRANLEKAQRYFQILKDECHREIALITDLLDLSRLESGQVALTLTSIQVRPWLQTVLAPMTAQFQSQQQQFTCDLPAILPTVTTDASVLESILTELLENARKYTPAGGHIGLSVTTQTTATLGDAPQMAFTVTNTGVEIPATERDRIFEKFYRIPNNDPWKYGGTGLGLALVKRQVALLGGTIRLTSVADATEFTVLLPLAGSPSAVVSTISNFSDPV